MPQFPQPYIHIRSALDTSDVALLRNACKRYISNAGIPCYVLIDDLHSPTYLKIKATLEESIRAPLYYLNDFYMYTDSSFKTNWHVDTELYAFECAVNAWILLSPDHVEDPLGFIDGINDSPERSFHSVRLEGDQCIFGNYCTGEMMTTPLVEIEEGKIHTPRITLGDILVFNPGRFHKTNLVTPKHAMAFKFVMEGPNGFLSSNQVDPALWPEVGVFNRLMRNASSWECVLDGIRRALKNDTDRKELCAGFYPEQFGLYRCMVNSL